MQLSESIKSGWDLIPELMEEMRKRNDGTLPSLCSPYDDLNNYIPRFYGGDLVVIAARPAMGKTAFALNLAMSFAAQGKASLFFSLEMSALQLGLRMLAALSGHSTKEISTAANNYDKIRTDYESILRNLYIVDSPGMTLDRIRAIIDKFGEDKSLNLGSIFVDYLQLIPTTGGSEYREKDIAACSSESKRIARTYSIPVFLLSQLNRGVEYRSSKRPVLSDLRESGAIEQDADIVLFLFRQDYYGGQKVVPGETEIIISKHRQGPTGIAKIFFDKERISFV